MPICHHRDVDQEDGPPAEQVQQEAAQSRPDDGAAADHGHHKANSFAPLVVGKSGGDDCHARTLRHGGARPLDDAGTNQNAQVGGEAGGNGEQGEYQGANDIDLLQADDVRQSTHRQQQGADGEGVADNDPLHRRDIGSKVARDGVQRHVDADLIGHRREGADGDGNEGPPFVVCALPDGGNHYKIIQD